MESSPVNGPFRKLPTYEPGEAGGTLAQLDALLQQVGPQDRDAVVGDRQHAPVAVVLDRLVDALARGADEVRQVLLRERQHDLDVAAALAAMRLAELEELLRQPAVD